jgi:TIGR03009 family protein
MPVQAQWPAAAGRRFRATGAPHMRRNSQKIFALGLLAMAALPLLLGVAGGQSPPAGYQGAGQASTAPDQPVQPQYPTLERRPQASPGPVLPGQAQGPSVRVPFMLSAEETAQLNEVLGVWESRNREVKSFECDVIRFRYDAVFANAAKPGQPSTVDHGTLRYSAPDKGKFAIEGQRPEQWICDGKAVYEYDYKRKLVIEHQLPPEMQGRAISEGPLPFVFGTDAQKMKDRYFLRIVTPRDAKDEIWLEAWPKLQKDAADFYKAEVILKSNGMVPFAVQLTDTNKKDRTVYQFDNTVVNRPMRFILGMTDLRVTVPWGWKRVVEPPPPPPAQAQRVRRQG